jgi:hypothetical protein
LNSGIENVPVIDSIVGVGAKKNEKFEFFSVFCEFSLKRKNRGKIFSAQKKRIEKTNPAV